MSKLKADSGLTSKVGGAVAPRIFDAVQPPGTTTPYIIVGDITEMPEDTMDKVGDNLTTTIYVVSEYKGNKELQDILVELNRILHRGSVTVTGYDNVFLFKDGVPPISRDADGVTRRMAARYRAINRSKT